MSAVQTADGRTRAIASPTKTFFVNMITRDIALEDCILDLIDNSVDGALKSVGSPPMRLSSEADLSPYLIEILANADSFCITDNCGGMTLEAAALHAFTFGRGSDNERSEFSIGVYGIGMKRAVFKIGSDIRISSTYTEQNGSRMSFAVPISVPEWMQSNDPPWDFAIVPDEALPHDGVRVSIGGLTPGTATSFGNPAFINNLRRVIARDYSLHLGRGLRIQVNGESVRGLKIELRSGGEFLPVRLEYSFSSGADEVVVEIVGGMAAPPPDDASPDEAAMGDRRFGWYVICNGRVVLAADKTAVSGWGTEGWPEWHRQYSGFIGVILFSARNAAALPLTTTKRSVDISSDVFLGARSKMREVTKAWITYTNQRKGDLEQARAREDAVPAVALQEVERRPAVVLPQITPIRRGTPVGNINYAIPVARIKRLAEGLGNGNMSYRDVGLKSFDYAYEELIGDE